MANGLPKYGELLVQEKLISKDQLKAALANAMEKKARLGSSLVQLGHLNEKVLATFLSKQFGIAATDLEGKKIPEDLQKIISQKICEKHCIAPIKKEGNKIFVAISDPTQVAAIDDVRFLTNLEVELVIATETSIKKMIQKSFSGEPEAITEDMSPTAPIEDLEKVLEESDGQENTGISYIGGANAGTEIDNDAVGEKPVIRLINKLFIEAIRRKTSDIHIEPFEKVIRVRFRIDGALHQIMEIPGQYRTAIPSRIKVMAAMDISEKRLPQDGRIQLRMKSGKKDVRVSTLPTIYGEKVVMRLLGGQSKIDLTQNGFEDDQLDTLRKAANQPYGMVLVTGPTGSGKSTTLYGILGELNQPDINISTVEDPVEQNMPGINQVQMKDGIGLNFAAALRSLLRQDPDIIMIGEIRDHETAEIAIKSSLTGHLVLSTLHTNDAPSTISRLLHMGVEPFLITASVTLVQAQRLIRVICEDCKTVDERITKQNLMNAEVPENWIESFQPMKGQGCQKCSNTGYRGRRGIYEVMYLTEELREMIIKGANADQLKLKAMEGGMLTLRQCAIRKLYRGETTLEEVLNNSRPDGDIQ